MTWFVQVKYPKKVPQTMPDGWITVAVCTSMRDAGRHAAFAYRDREHPDDGMPNQLRIRSEAQLRRQGGEALVKVALTSLREFGERTAAADG